MSEEVKYLIGISVFLVVFVIPWVVLWRYYKKKPVKSVKVYRNDVDEGMRLVNMIKINLIIKQMRKDGDNVYLVIEFVENYAQELKAKWNEEARYRLTTHEEYRRQKKSINFRWDDIEEGEREAEAYYTLAKRLREEFPNVIENYCGIKSVAQERERIRIKYTGIFKEL